MNSKFVLMDSGESTSSFVTGKAKMPKSPVGALTPSSGSNNSNVDVAAIIESGGDSAAISAAASAAVSAQSAALISEYMAKFATLPGSIPERIAKYTSERITKSKGDKDSDNNEYNPVLITVGDALNDLNANDEETAETKAEESIKNKTTKAEDEAKEHLQQAAASAQEKIEKGLAVIEEIVSHMLEGAEWIQQNVDKAIASVINAIQKELDTAYKKAEEKVDKFCENEGNKKGAKLVEQQNNAIKKSAKNIIDEKIKAEKKAKIKADALIQKAKLQLFALIGL